MAVQKITGEIPSIKTLVSMNSISRVCFSINYYVFVYIYEYMDLVFFFLNQRELHFTYATHVRIQYSY